MLGIEALPAVDGAGGAAIGERAEEIERVGVAHRHDQQRGVTAAQAQFHFGHQRQASRCPMAAHRALRFARGPEVYISVQDGRRGHRCVAGRPSRARSGLHTRDNPRAPAAEDDEVLRRHGKIGAH